MVTIILDIKELDEIVPIEGTMEEKMEWIRQEVIRDYGFERHKFIFLSDDDIITEVGDKDYIQMF